MKIILFIVIFLLMNAFLIISNNNLHINNTENIKQVFVLYGDWIKQVSGNLGQVTGDAVKLDWTPEKIEVREA